MMRYFLVFVIFFVVSCNANKKSELLLSAAMSLKDAVTEVGKLFQKKHPAFSLRINFASSGTLARQIEAGAPVDLFLSASQNEMDRLEKKKMVLAGSRFDFIANGLVLVIPRYYKKSITKMEDLKKQGVDKISIGNPVTVPAGRYAFEALRRFKLYPAVKKRLIYGEHVRQVLDYIVRGEVDAGFVYATDYKMRKDKLQKVMLLPAESHSPILYPASIIKRALIKKGTRKFLLFLRSERAQRIFIKHGFIPIKAREKY